MEQYGGKNGLCQLIAETKEMIAPYVESDPTRFCTYEEFEKGVTALEEFCSARLDSIEGDQEDQDKVIDDILKFVTDWLVSHILHNDKLIGKL